MSDRAINRWGNKLLKGLNEKWSDIPEQAQTGFTIFYSPIKFRPYLLIIGDNPGGNEFIKQRTLPKEHEYFKYDYPLALSMRDKIFKGEKLSKILQSSVKTNRIFFKTRNLKQFESLSNSKDMETYCFQILQQIIKTLEPNVIFAESLGTFRKLSTFEKVILSKEKNNKALLVYGKYKNIPVFGINHPSRASFHKINDEDWSKVNTKLLEIFQEDKLDLQTFY
ncbi:hypothetical protein [Flagellimonas sp.]|uniref:hypothetical protein n=1 Tax=Flagellimonas sp. TaxID=2058762 RepID=UPI003BAB74E2